IDFPYVQPPLSSEQAADSNLVYAVLGVRGDSLDPCLLQEHLEKFFSISVLKGRDAATEPTAAVQLSLLAKECAGRKLLRLFRGDHLPDIGSDDSMKRPTSLRDALRHNEPR